MIGLLPVFVDLGNRPDPAHLLLDGRPACELTLNTPGCMVDLGSEPTIHLLELVRTDASGRIKERVRRWINRPGVEAELHTNGRCEEATRSCTFNVAWAHPGKLDPVSLMLSLDGQAVWDGVTSTVKVRFPRSRPPQIVNAEAAFRDGRRATFTQLLHGSYPETTEASLQAIPVEADAAAKPEEIASVLRKAAWEVEGVEQKDFEVIFVIEPRAFERLPNLAMAAMQNLILYSTPLGDAQRIRVLVPADTITSFDVLSATDAKSNPSIPVRSRVAHPGPSQSNPSSWVRRLILADRQVSSIDRLRTADAVAVAGYTLGASPRRRLIVLIAASSQEDHSSFSPAQVQAYLRQTLVPIAVWRVRDGAAPGWPEGLVLRTPNDFAAALAKLRRALDHQYVAWLKGRTDLRSFHPSVPSGIRLARPPASGKSAEGAKP